jgi:hypothetical protein
MLVWYLMRPRPVLLLLGALTLGSTGLGCGAEPGCPVDAAADAGGDGGIPGPSYTIAVLPDTQYYASSWPEIFASQTRFLLENRGSRQLAFALHTGDIVDQDTPEQWNVASDALHVLDGQLPYVITAGNHDYATLADRMGMGNLYFPPSQFAAYPWFQGTFEAGHIENSFSVFAVPDGKWLVIALEFGPRDEVLAWANDILRLYRDTRAIIITHAYLYRDGTLYDHVNAPGQQYNPHAYTMMGQAGTTINDGAEMWTKLVAPNSNVQFVFSGHDVNGELIPPGTAARLTSVRDDGTWVHQLVANYQTCTAAPCSATHGGNGFLRLLHVTAGAVSVETYSPYLDKTLTDPDNRFDLPLR